MPHSRSVLVTGGTRGIGKGIARVFTQLGDRVALIGRNPDAGSACVAEWADASVVPLFLQADVCSRSAMDAAAVALEAQHGGLDVLCCNVGIFPQAMIETMQESDWDLVMGTNLKGLLTTIQIFLPMLKRSSAPRVVLTSSITGPITGYPGWAHYGASKAAMLGFMRTAAIELAPYRITINAVLPGSIKTEQIVALGEEFELATSKVIPLKRFGLPEEVGHAVAFFASREASYITGQTLVVDGGQVLPESPMCFE